MVEIRHDEPFIDNMLQFTLSISASVNDIVFAIVVVLVWSLYDISTILLLKSVTDVTVVLSVCNVKISDVL